MSRPPRWLVPSGVSSPEVSRPPRCLVSRGILSRKVSRPPRCLIPRGVSSPEVARPPRCLVPRGVLSPEVSHPPRCLVSRGVSSPEVACLPRWLVPRGGSSPEVSGPPRWLVPRGGLSPEVAPAKSSSHLSFVLACVSSSLEQHLLALMGGKSPRNLAEIRWTQVPEGELSTCPYPNIPGEGLGHRCCLNEDLGPCRGLWAPGRPARGHHGSAASADGDRAVLLGGGGAHDGRARVAGEDQHAAAAHGHRRLCRDGRKALGHVLRGLSGGRSLRFPRLRC